MWRLNTFIILIICCMVICTPTKEPKSEDEIQAEKIINVAKHRIEAHWVKLREIFLNSHRKDSHKPKYLMEETLKKYRSFEIELATNLSSLHVRKLQHENLKRQVRLLQMLQINGLNEEDYQKSQDILNFTRQFPTNKVVCTIDDCSDRIPYLPSAQKIIIKSRNPDEMSFYWRAWRDAISKDARSAFLDYIELYRKAASLNGHVTPSRTWYMNYQVENFLGELTQAMDQIQPLYKEFHAYLRHVYRVHYGAEYVDERGPIPDHFMEQIIQHAWKANSIFKPPYPDHHLPNIYQKMEEEKFTPLKALEMASNFFESIGMMNLPSDFWIRYAIEMTEEEGGPDCKAEVFFFPPNVGIKYCPKVDYKKFLQMHGYMAEIQYNVYRTRLPYGLNGEAFPGMSNAIGEAFIIAASSPKHLKKRKLMDNYSKEITMNRLFRMGVHTIFTLPKYFVNEKFWVEALDHKISPDKLNCGYWKISEEFTGVSPPEKRTEEHFDPGYKFYNGLDDHKATTLKIISEMLGYQIYRALCIKSGQYVPNYSSDPLHNCDFSENLEVGKPLIEVMSLGSIKHWRDVLDILTGERTINADAMLEYYQPLYEWLKEQNSANGVEVGWESSDLCDS